MQCDAVRAILMDARYQENQTQDAQVASAKAHLETCSACEAFQLNQGGLDAALALDTDDEPRPGFDTRFFALLAEEKAANEGAEARLAWWKWARLRWVVSAAVIPLAAMSVVTFFVEQRPSSMGADSPGASSSMSTAAMAGVDSPNLSGGELALMEDLELLEELDVVAQLEDIETFELLAQLDIADLGGSDTPDSDTGPATPLLPKAREEKRP